MGRRSKVAQYPAAIREWLDAELIRRGFGDYGQLAADLKKESAARGAPVDASKSALHRYGTKLERRIQSVKDGTWAAQAIAKAAPDDEDLRAAAVISMIQTQNVNTLIDLEEATDQLDPLKKAKLLAVIAKNSATLVRASLKQKQHELEIRSKAHAAADKVARMAKKGGMSEATVDEIRRAVLGIAA